jgi:hypothetical protein
MLSDDGRFVESLLGQQKKKFERRYRLQSHGEDFDKILDRVGKFVRVRR